MLRNARSRGKRLRESSVRSSLTVLLLMTLCACGSAGGDEVEMLDNTFRPGDFEVAVGQTVTFINNGRAPHNVIADDGTFDSRRALGRNHDSGEEWKYTPTSAGEYPYYCSLHAVQRDDGTWTGMVGTLIVTE